METVVEILECGHPPTPQAPNSCTVGYGSDSNGFRSCYACCAEIDRAWMAEHGRISLYFDGSKVSNWPGSLSFKPTSVSKSRRSGFGVPFPREDFNFKGPDGFVWHGFRQGNNTMIAHCRRTKRKAA